VSPNSPSVAIVTDSTCDIPEDMADALHIRIVRSLLTLDDQTYEDGSGLSRAEFYTRVPSLPRPARTASPSPAAFEAAYESALSSGAQNVVSIHVSSHLSGIFNAATQAAKGFGERVLAFDGEHVSMALGFQAILAAEAALEGATLGAVMRVAEEARRRARLIALIDTLEYLKRSGRVTWLRAGIGDLLRVKLLVSVVHGWVKRIGMVRTKTRALERLQSIAGSWGRIDRLAVLHSGAPEAAHLYAEQVRSLSDRPLILAEVTPVIGAHIGPGCLGLAALLATI
jgi:DegV family protein with EDD domain